MASSDSGGRVRPSVLDRLIDRSPEEKADPVDGWGGSALRYKRSVLRDLEWLLNTRRTPEPAPDDLPLVRDSVYNYGLPDLSSLSADSSEDRRTLLREVQKTLRAFEPRLDSVQVTAADPDETSQPEIRLSVQGLLLMDPEPERVSFDTVLELASGHFDVEEEG